MLGRPINFAGIKGKAHLARLHAVHGFSPSHIAMALARRPDYGCGIRAQEPVPLANNQAVRLRTKVCSLANL